MLDWKKVKAQIYRIASTVAYHFSGNASTCFMRVWKCSIRSLQHLLMNLQPDPECIYGPATQQYHY